MLGSIFPLLVFGYDITGASIFLVSHSKRKSIPVTVKIESQQRAKENGPLQVAVLLPIVMDLDAFTVRHRKLYFENIC